LAKFVGDAMLTLIYSLLMGILAGKLFSVFVKKRRFGSAGNMVIGAIGSLGGMFLELALFNNSDYSPSFIRATIVLIIGAVGPLVVTNSFLRSEGNIPSPNKATRQSASNDVSPQREHSRQTMSNIFISYRRQDNPDITGRLYDRLVNHFGPERVFRDVDSVPLGVDYRKYLDEEVGKCRILIAVLGNRWLDAKDTEGMRRIDSRGDFVRIEIESALKRGIPVIPILVSGAAMPTEDDLPPTLRDLAYRNALPVRTDPDFHKDVDRLIAGLETHLQKVAPSA
jgi:uncharacterized membrane protein YeaQ/YmgE (transglycosylase-associated protein family)